MSLAYLFTGRMQTADSYLLGGRPFNASEIAAVQSAIGAAGLQGAVIEGNRVRVPQGEEAAYVAALADAGALPADFHSILDKTIGELSPFAAPEQRKEMIKNAKQRELANIVRSMPQIDSAAVHYDIQRRPGLSRSNIATASVSVKPMMGATLTAQRARMIRHLVASAIAGMSPKDVVVVDVSGQTFMDESDPDGDGEAQKYLSAMKAYQSWVESQVNRALSYVPGATVTANVELTKEIESTKENVGFDPKRSGETQVHEESVTSKTSNNAPAGRPGVAAQNRSLANQAAELSGAAGRTSSSDSETSVRTASMAPGHEVTRSRSVGLTPQRVTVAVGVPSSYFEGVWRQRQPATADPAAQARPGRIGSHRARRNAKDSQARGAAHRLGDRHQRRHRGGAGDNISPRQDARAGGAVVCRQSFGLAQAKLRHVGPDGPGVGQLRDAAVDGESRAVSGGGRRQVGR